MDEIYWFINKFENRLHLKTEWAVIKGNLTLGPLAYLGATFRPLSIILLESTG